MICRGKSRGGTREGGEVKKHSAASRIRCDPPERAVAGTANGAVTGDLVVQVAFENINAVSRLELARPSGDTLLVRWNPKGALPTTTAHHLDSRNNPI